MNVKVCLISISAIALVALAPGVTAQQRNAPTPPRATAYDAGREGVVQGTVVSYTENSGRAPVGAHATVQTPTGQVEVQLGPSSYLRANNFSLTPGEFVRFVGANVFANKSNVFLARIAQKGSQTLEIRSSRGFPQPGHTSRTLPDAQRAVATAQQARPR